MAFPPKLMATLRQARNVMAVTGAGISAESGIPTFREALTGLWAQYDPAELATPAAFRRDPALVWDWYCWRRETVLAVEPNIGHRALVELQARYPRFLLVTQNVDELHQRAGSSLVLELHGSLLRARCLDGGHVAAAWPPTSPGAGPPGCAWCNSPLRPDVVWFGEGLPAGPLHQAMQAARHCDVLLSIGTSSVVYPAASLAELAVRGGATVIEINPDQTPLSNAAHFALRGSASDILASLVEQLQTTQSGE